MRNYGKFFRDILLTGVGVLVFIWDGRLRLG